MTGTAAGKRVWGWPSLTGGCRIVVRDFRGDARAYMYGTYAYDVTHYTLVAGLLNSFFAAITLCIRVEDDMEERKYNPMRWSHDEARR